MRETPPASLEHTLSRACVVLSAAKLPATTRRAAEQVILDWLGCTLLGSEAPPANVIAATHAAELHSGPATCFVGPTTCAAGLAALISGTAAHTAELDDIYSPALYHPGVCVIPAALAACQLAGANGDTFVRSVVAGYEISNRIGVAINPVHYDYWHTTGTVGTFGAAIASSVALRLSVQQVEWALGHAASMAAGLQQAFRSNGMTKPLHAGRAAEGGLLAARLAGSGFTGSDSMLSGPVGFVKAMSHGRDIRPAFADLLDRWTIERTTFKQYSACGHIFAAIDAVLDLVAAEKPTIDALQRIEIATYAKALDVAGIHHPSSAFEAKFSIPFCVAAAVLGHDLSNPANFERLHNEPQVHTLIDRVEVRADPEISSAFPGLRGARAALQFADGRQQSHFVATRKGDPDNPLSSRELESKFRRLVAATGHRGQETALIEWARGLPNHASLSPHSLPLVHPRWL
jgi:2-methylcitrate dehydratase PrpD